MSKKITTQQTALPISTPVARESDFDFAKAHCGHTWPKVGHEIPSAMWDQSAKTKDWPRDFKGRRKFTLAQVVPIAGANVAALVAAYNERAAFYRAEEAKEKAYRAQAKVQAKAAPTTVAAPAATPVGYITLAEFETRSVAIAKAACDQLLAGLKAANMLKIRASQSVTSGVGSNAHPFFLPGRLLPPSSGGVEKQSKGDRNEIEH